MPGVRLVPFSHRHLDELRRWFPDHRSAVLWAGSAIDFPLVPEALLAADDAHRVPRPERRAWTAFDDADEIVGHAQVRFDWRDGTGTLMRVGVAPERRGEGIAAPMLRPVIDDAFGLAGLERLELNVYDFNAAAIGLYGRLGFVREGVRRASARVGGERWNTVIMGLLRNEWEAAA